MKCRKVLSGMLGVVLLFSANTRAVNAEEIQLDNAMDQSNEINYVEIPKEEAIPSGLDEKEANYMDRQYEGKQYSVSEYKSTYNRKREVAENTDPNYAYIVENDMVVQGSV